MAGVFLYAAGGARPVIQRGAVSDDTANSMLVGKEGLEPSSRKRDDILSVARMPIPPLARLIFEVASGFEPEYRVLSGFARSSAARQTSLSLYEARRRIELL